MCAHSCAHTYINGNTCLSMDMEGQKPNSGVFPCGSLPLSLRQGLSLNLDLFVLNQTGWRIPVMIVSLPLRTPTSPRTESVHHHACPLCGLWGSNIKIPVLAWQLFYPMSRLSSPFICLFVELLICVCMHVASVCECSYVCGCTHQGGMCMWQLRVDAGCFLQSLSILQEPKSLAEPGVHLFGFWARKFQHGYVGGGGQ